MADNEHSAASLRDSEELSVKHSVREPIPEFGHAPEEGAQVPSVVRGQNAGDVLPYAPAGTKAVKDAEIDERKVSTGISEPGAESGDAE